MNVGKTSIGILLFVYATFTGAAQEGILAKEFHPAGASVFGSSDDSTAQAVAVQADGKSVIAGSYVIGTEHRFAIARFNEDGSFDESFGENGLVITSFGAGETASNATAIALQPDGKIIAGGFSNAIHKKFHACLARYQSDGSLDESFFGDRGIIPGTIVTAFSLAERASQFSDIALQPDGHIVAVGWSAESDSIRMAIARYTKEGKLDHSFNGAASHRDEERGLKGGFTFRCDEKRSSDDRAHAVAVQADGKIIVVGTSNALGYTSAALLRLTPQGTLDTSFYDIHRSRQHGVVLTTFGAGEKESAAHAVAVQPDGKVVIGGYTDSNCPKSKRHFALARYDRHGILDASFGGDGLALLPGTAITSFGADEDEGRVNALLLQPDGKIIAGGMTCSGKRRMFALARYTPHGVLDATFNGGSDTVAGTVRTSFDTSKHDEVYDISINPSGAIIAVGKTHATARPTFAIARYSAPSAAISAPRIEVPMVGERIIDGSAVIVHGKAQKGGFVTMLVDDVPVVNVVADCESGSFDAQLAPLASGYHTITAIESYMNGKSLTQSSPVTIHIDQHPSPVPATLETIEVAPVTHTLHAEGASGNYHFKIINAHNGTVSLFPDNAVLFMPWIKEGTGKVVFEAIDDLTDCSTQGTIDILVHKKPRAVDCSLSTAYNTPLHGALCQASIEGQPPFIFNLLEVKGGQIDWHTNGEFTFVPATDFSGKALVKYTVTDSHGGESAPALAEIMVHESPRCMPAPAWVLQGQKVEGSLAPYVSGGLQPYHFEQAGAIGNGAIALQDDGAYTFLASKNYIGMITIPFRVTDSNGSTTHAMLEMMVKTAPRMIDSSYVMGEGDALRVSLADLIEGGAAPYTFAVENVSEQAEVVLAEDGSVIVQPAKNFSGELSFVYYGIDMHGTKTNEATCFVRVKQKPTSVPLEKESFQGDPITGSLAGLVSGGQPPYTFSMVSEPESGSLTINADGSYTFVPHENVSGTVTFAYMAVDNAEIATEGSVTLTIHEKPRAYPHEEEIGQGTHLIGSLAPHVVGGCPPYTFAKIERSAEGNLIIEADGSYQFTPHANVKGDVSFAYSVTDARDASTTGSVIVHVYERPVIKSATVHAAQAETIKGTLANMVTGGKQPYTFTKVDDLPKQSFSIESDGSYAIELPADFTGKVKCTYVVTDARNVKSNVGVITIPVYEKPRVFNQTHEIEKGQELHGTMAPYIHGGIMPYTFKKGAEVEQGLYTMQSDGSYDFIPSSDFIGTVMLPYVVFDGKKVKSDEGTITVMVHQPISAESLLDLQQKESLDNEIEAIAHESDNALNG